MAKKIDEPVNRARGEARVTVDGVTHTLCLSMRAIAEIEDALGVDNLAQAQDRLSGGSSRDFAAILGALVRGGGSRVTNEEVRYWPLSMHEVMAAILAGFGGAGLVASAEDVSGGN